MNSSLQRTLFIFSFAALTALAVVVFMGKSYENSLQALDSTTHAMLAQEVTQNGMKPVLPMPNFVTNQRSDLTFNDHPFTLFYLSGQAMRYFGPSAWSARLVPTFFSVGSVLLLAILGTLLYSPAAGLVAGLIFLTSRDFILIGSRFHLDSAMIFFIILSFIAWRKDKPILTGIAAGLGLWMKSPVAFLIFPSAFFALLMTGEMTKKNFLKIFYSGLVALVVGFGIWIITGFIGGWDLVTDYWSRQVWGTAVGGRGIPVNRNFWFGMELLKRTYYPWIFLLATSLVLMILKKRWKRPEVALPLAAALVLELVISSMRFKFYWYFLPVFPFLALICVDSIHAWLAKRSVGVSQFMIGAGLFVPAFLLATPIDFGPENFPALRRFEPIIQNYGSASDHILFIDGHQPYGSDLDSMYELSFYTGRKILQAKCELAKDLVTHENPEWIVVTGPHLTECLSAEQLKSYPVQYQFGRQFLLSRIIPQSKAMDLTPLVRELKPLLRGAPAPLPQDGYFPRESK